MRMSLGQEMRMAQKQVLAPRMIQSMEILQLPLMALEERIEQEIQNNETLEVIEPEAEAAGRVIDLLVPLKTGATDFVRTAGRRALCLAWLLGRRPEPLAELARQLGISRASLSTHVRRIEDLTGLHGRGQKGATTRATYAATAKQGWKLRRVNKLMAAAVGE